MEWGSRRGKDGSLHIQKFEAHQYQTGTDYAFRMRYTDLNSNGFNSSSDKSQESSEHGGGMHS